MVARHIVKHKLKLEGNLKRKILGIRQNVNIKEEKL